MSTIYSFPDQGKPIESANDPRIADIQAIQKVAGPTRKRCVYCNQPICHVPAVRAFFRGHVYSDAGLQEIRITGICEYCFDEVMIEITEEQLPPEPEDPRSVDIGDLEETLDMRKSSDE